VECETKSEKNWKYKTKKLVFKIEETITVKNRRNKISKINQSSVDLMVIDVELGRKNHGSVSYNYD
jgi:hypothetical protein